MQRAVDSLKGSVWVLAAGILMVSLHGCGPSGPKRVQVTGTVTFNGTPVRAMVTFIPDGASGHPARGMTDETGAFALGTFAPRDGAIPGQYRVSVLPAEPPPLPGYPEAKSYKSPLPKQYGDPATSGFTADVKDEGENDFTFALK